MERRADEMAAKGLQRVATLPRHSSAIQQMSTELVRACLLLVR